MQTFLIDRTATPVGELVLIADEQGRLRAIDWTRSRSAPDEAAEYPLPRRSLHPA